MSKQKQNNGNKVFHRIAKELKLDFIEANNRNPNLQEWNAIQKQASSQIYQPKFKGKPNRKVRKKDIIEAVEDLFEEITKKKEAKKQPCSSVFDVDDALIEDFEWWNLQTAITGFPKDVQVNIGGVSKMEDTGIQKLGDIPDDDIKSIVESIRKKTENKSGLIYYVARKKVKGAEDDGSNCNYYIDFILGSDEVVPSEIDEAIEDDRDLSLEEQEERIRKLKKQRAEQAKKRKARKTEKPKLEPEKQKTKKKKKKKKKKKQKKQKAQAEVKETRALLSEARQDLKDGLITKAQYRKLFDKLSDKLEKGGEI